MPLRRRLSWAIALVAIAVVVVSAGAAWVTARTLMRDSVDDALRAQADVVLDADSSPGGMVLRARDGSDRLLVLPEPPARQGGPSEYAQTLAADGSVVTTRGDLVLPVAPIDLLAIARARAVGPRDVWIGGAHLRMMTVPLTGAAASRFDAVAVQIARPLSGVDRALKALWMVLLAVGAVTVTVAVLIARGVARRILRPVRDLDAAAAHVEETAELDARIPVQSDDELGALTRRFNAMMARLQSYREDLRRSIADQRNLVADASHELRTPVTSLRTNAEVLLESEPDLSPDDRREILEDVRDQAEDLGRLVSDLIELARGDDPDQGPREPVAFDAVVEECLMRARRDHRDVEFRAELAPATVVGRPDRLARAVSNLLNNAGLHGAGASGHVEVTLTTGLTGPPDGGDRAHDGPLWSGHSEGPPTAAATLRIVDHGPGVPDAERERIFDRFRRGDGSRMRHGSGLGLAIVRQTATSHRGTVVFEETPGGGATFVLTLPTADRT